MDKEDILSAIGAIGLVFLILVGYFYFENIHEESNLSPEEKAIKNIPSENYYGTEFKELYKNTHYAFFVLYNPNIDEDISFETLDYIGLKKPFNSQQWQNIYIFNKIPKLEKILNYPNEGNSMDMEYYLKSQKPLAIMVNAATYELGKSICIYRENQNKYDFFRNNASTRFKWVNYEDEVWRCLPYELD